ncbi:MAG: hypothetical protein IJG68_01210 [Bacilli bacterium]|nr:hypothetical protein [Bacilli bacterium]
MRKNNKQVTTYFILLSLLLIAVVYAILQANLQINGTAKIKANTWDIHFNNIQVNENSVSIGTGDSPATIDPNNNCKVDFEVTLGVPGDFYEFTIDVVNAGTIDGMIGTINKTLIVNNEPVESIPDYLDYIVTYSDGIEILENHKIEAGTTETYLVRLEFKTDIEELPETSTISTSLEPQYIQADSSSIIRPISFENSSWNRIIDAYNSGDISSLQTAMESGTTREVQLDMDYDGIPETIAHVRIANLSKPSECSTEGFSQTACGFVIEFADIITTRRINPYSGDASRIGYGNKGGWEHSDMRAYLNSTKYLEGTTEEIDYTTIGFYNMLPNDLKTKVIDTTVISGYGPNDFTNITTEDKIYFFDPKEIFGTSYTNGNNYLKEYDTAKNQERQLDYYIIQYTINPSTRIAIKKSLDNTILKWWLRSPSYDFDYCFFYIQESGYVSRYQSANTLGVSPAFRIAE